MLNWWGDLSVSKKLYAVVGVMASLIAIELITLLFAMDVLSAVRSFVGGEGLWSKGQKNAVHSLHRYAFTHDPKYFADFHKNLEINMGDRAARLELSKPNPDLQIVTDGFIRGGNHPDDIPGLIKLIQRFHWVDHIERALVIWAQADAMIDDLVAAATQLDVAIRTEPGNVRQIDQHLLAVDALNDELTVLENQFSEILGAGSRWLERLLMIVLVLAVLTVETTGVLLTVLFSRNLNRSLRELRDTAQEVGRGNFDVTVPVRSRDELGQLAESINKMIRDLKTSIGRRVRAENASQVKSQFLANMSHEIRTPLGVILGLTEILKDPKLSWQDHLRYVDTIDRTGKNLTRIINDILDLSKVEAGHLEVQISRFSLVEFMDELKVMLSIQAGKTGNKLYFKSQGPLPLAVTTDRTRLRQILVNLVNNALKYTSQGEVTVTYRITKQFVVFEVRDTGRGISVPDRERLFEAFVRTEHLTTESPEGTGLGLMLSKRLARALGGDVALVESTPGQGSTFRASVECAPEMEALAETGAPIVAPPEPATDPRPQSKLAGKKVLVVEDSEDNQLLVKLFLTRQGINVDFAANGQEGLDQALAVDYDVVLMDMQMPVMDGYRATKVLRERGFAKPIIALTAHAMKEDRERCMGAGCSDYMTKPVDSKSLSETISRHI